MIRGDYLESQWLVIMGYFQATLSELWNYGLLSGNYELLVISSLPSWRGLGYLGRHLKSSVAKNSGPLPINYGLLWGLGC